ncbi:MAG: hypothetical protein RL134_126, partial [Actinomycetota bacterium]
GGIWNAEVVLASRGTALTWVLGVCVLALGAWGARDLLRALGRGIAMWWGLVALVGLVGAVASALLPGIWSAAVDIVPGGGLLRDAQKLLAAWVLLLAAAAGAGAARLLSVLRDRASRVTVLLALVVLPVACQPDLLWGAGGRLQPVDYPDDWAAVRAELMSSDRPGDVASFPWTAFRRFTWNADRTVLDPAPRWLPRTTVVADDLVVETPEGPVSIGGDDPRAQAITSAVATGEPIAGLLPAQGVGWALVALNTPGPVPELPGWDLVVEGPDLELYAAPRGSVEVRSTDVRLVAVVDLALVAALVAGLAALAIRRVRSRKPGPLVR